MTFASTRGGMSSQAAQGLAMVKCQSAEEEGKDSILSEGVVSTWHLLC